MITVSDSTPLIHLGKIGKIDTLKRLFEKIIIEDEIYKEIIRKAFSEQLKIEARYSIQKADNIKNKQIAYHLRIYKKEFIKRFFENINTIKLKPEKNFLCRKMA